MLPRGGLPSPTSVAHRSLSPRLARSPSKRVPPGGACLPWANWPRDAVPADPSSPSVPSPSPQPLLLGEARG